MLCMMSRVSVEVQFFVSVKALAIRATIQSNQINMIYAMHAPTLRLSQHVPQVKQRSPVHTPRTPVQASLQRKSGLDAPARVVVAGEYTDTDIHCGWDYRTHASLHTSLGFAALWMATVAHAAHASTCPNFTMAPNGLQYCDEVVGTGTTPAAGSLIK